jgi:hypothetical protein
MRNLQCLQSSYEEYDPEKVEKKSEEFLRTVMGNEKFDKLQKNGKIEIKVGNKPNEETVYELYSDGKLINKTRNQSYCIVADRSDYPTNDIIAIKYAWLVRSNSTVEKVANKTNITAGERANRSRLTNGYADFIREMEQRGWSRQTIHIGDSPYYGDYVDYLSGNGWRRELITLNEYNTNIVSIRDVQKDDTGCVINIVCPAGQKMAIMGRMQTPRGTSLDSAYSLGLCITDENGVEIPDDTKIRIAKVKPSDAIIQLARIYYSDVKIQNGKSMYTFQHGIELNGEVHLNIFVVDSPCNIPATGIKFKLETDIWTRNT